MLLEVVGDDDVVAVPNNVADEGVDEQFACFDVVFAVVYDKFCRVPVVRFGAALGFDARARSARVTVRRKPHRQLRRRLVYSQAHT